MPNAFAYFVLFSWPLVTFILFRTLPRTNALVISIVGGYLILPQSTGFDFPLLPVLDKHSIPALSAAIMCYVTRTGETGNRNTISIQERETPGPGSFRKKKGGYVFLIALLIGAAFMTVITNGEPVIYGIAYRPGLRIYDAFSIILGELITILPFFLGWKYLSSEADHRILLKIFAISGLCYSLLALFEVRMSPQLNIWLYGFFPHSFLQHIRGDGYRPIVFLQHGLWVSIFFTITILSVVALLKSRTDARSHTWLVAAGIWLMFTLFLTKSLGAFALALLFIPIILSMGVTGQMRVAMCVAGLVVIYPLLRGADLVPVHEVVNLAERINPERAASFTTRIENEDQVLLKTNQKQMFGWGVGGRAHTYNPESGRSITVMDGSWIIIMGSFGWIGYIARFGLLTLPIFALAMPSKRKHLTVVTSGLCIILAVNLIDLIPNATLTSVTWLITGALAGIMLQNTSSVTVAQPTEKISDHTRLVSHKRRPRGE